MPTPPEHAFKEKSTKLLILPSLRTIYNCTFQCETPCIMTFLFFLGQGPQTGPKGVIEDWRRFKQLETEKRQDNERERVALCKKLALTCRSEREDKEADEEVEKLEQVKV